MVLICKSASASDPGEVTSDQPTVCRGEVVRTLRVELEVMWSPLWLSGAHWARKEAWSCRGPHSVSWGTCLSEPHFRCSCQQPCASG